MKRQILVAALLLVALCGSSPADTPSDAETQDTVNKIRALAWVKGPAKVPVGTNSTLAVPEHFVFLNAENTSKFEDLNHNLSNGTEVMVAPDSFQWTAYLWFSSEGYIKDDDKIDAAEILKTLKDGTEQANDERKRRGWAPLHVVDWATPPAYNRTTKRLEWATILESEDGRGINFFTKVLGRRGYTNVVLVTAPDNLTGAATDLNSVLNGYTFNSGETYAEWRPGDKVAEYGLAALIVGGAAAVATKKGLWAVLGGMIAGAWKLIAAVLVGAMAWLKSLFSRKKT